MIPHRSLILTGFLLVVSLIGTSNPLHAEEPLPITIIMVDFQYRPDTLTLPVAHPVMLSLVNKGTVPHEFESDLLTQQDIEVRIQGAIVEGSGIEEVSIPPGTKAEILFVPKSKGSYRFQCDIKGHNQMVGTILVE